MVAIVAAKPSERKKNIIFIAKIHTKSPNEIAEIEWETFWLNSTFLRMRTESHTHINTHRNNINNNDAKKKMYSREAANKTKHKKYVFEFCIYGVQEQQLTRRASIGNTKSVADKTILFGPFDKRFFSK